LLINSVHTIQVPVLVDLEVTLALVHHISKRPKGWQENIFAFIFVRAEKTIEATSEQEESRPKMSCVEKLKNQWRKICREKDGVKKDDDKKFEDETEDTIKDHLKEIIKLYHEEYDAGSQPKDKSVGITPMLFIAALLKWYGFTAAAKVVNGFESLVKIDKMLVAADKGLRQGNLEVKKENCDKANVTLTNLNQSLTGLHSRVSYVEESARDMRSPSCTMIKFVKSEVGDKMDPMLRELDEFDSAKYVERDNDKFDLIRRAMQQYQTDIKSLKVHLTINIGLVSSLPRHPKKQG
jgi:hypothetical protein